MSSSTITQRSTMIISAGSNDSSENLLSIPNQRIVNSVSSISNNTYSPTQNSYLDSQKSQKSGKSYLSSISENSNKSLPNPPHTPSKTKFERQADASSKYELKNVLSFLAFFIALIFFFGSLSGLGPPFDDLD